MIDVAYVIGNFNKEHGGAQQLLFDICRHLPADEFETTVYYMFGEGTYRSQFEAQGTTVLDLSASSNYDVGAFVHLVRELRARDHDVVHTNSPISGAWGRTAAALARTPTTVSVEHNVHEEYRRLSRLVNGLTLPLADAVVGVSQTVTESYPGWETLIQGDSTRRLTVRNGVDVEAIEETFDRSEEVLKEFTPFSPSDRIVGTMGRLHEQKGYEYLVRSVPEIKQQVEDAKVLVIGDGPARETVEAMANGTGHADDIHFTGYVPSVYPFLPAFDVAVFPSLWEGFGLTPVESMVARRPVVASDIQTFREVVDGAGVLVEPRNESALASAVVSLLRDESRRRELGEDGYDRAIEKFSIERTVREYAELYRDLAHE